ncbi:hypothetical protein, partial [Escherichia coli]
ELGPVNATIHKINECVNAADLQLLARMYISKCCGVSHTNHHRRTIVFT